MKMGRLDWKEDSKLASLITIGILGYRYSYISPRMDKKSQVNTNSITPPTLYFNP